MKIINATATGANIRKIAEGCGFSVADLSKALGVSPQAVYRWFSEDHNNLPSVDNLIILSSLFGTSVDALLVSDEIEEEPGY